MRAALLIALLLPLSAGAEGEGVGVPASDEALVVSVEEATLSDKSPEQIHSPILVYDERARAEPPSKDNRDDAKKTGKSGATLSVPLGGTSGASSSRPQRTSPRTAQPANAVPTYAAPSDVRAATADNRFTANTNPCSSSGYHDNVMKKGLDVARMNCQMHQLDKNRSALWSLAGGDPLLRWTMEKQLDKGLDVFNVPK